MTNQEAIRILSDLHDQCCQADSVFCTDVTGARCDAVDMAISALQAQDSKTRKICDTCKHDPPSKKWPCVDCDMREPADRWELQDVPDTNDGDMISRRAAIELAMQYCPDDDGSCSKADRDIRELLDDLENLPPAQPDLQPTCNNLATDTISRQAEIEAIERIFDRCEEIEAHLPEGDPDRVGYKMYNDWLTVWKYLHQLPSVQHESYRAERKTDEKKNI